MLTVEQNVIPNKGDLPECLYNVMTNANAQAVTCAHTKLSSGMGMAVPSRTNNSSDKEADTFVEVLVPPALLTLDANRQKQMRNDSGSAIVLHLCHFERCQLGPKIDWAARKAQRIAKAAEATTSS